MEGDPMRGPASTSILSASIVLLLTVVPSRIQSQGTTSSARNPRSSLAQAIWNGDLTTVKRLLARGADPLEPEQQGPPPFLAPWEVALVAGDNDALRLLLEKIPTLPKSDDRAARRLTTTAAMNNIDATRLLISRRLPVDVPIEAGSGGTALLIAAEGGHVGVMELLINAGADVRVQDKQGDSPLMGAIRIGSLDAVRLLLKNGADVDQRDNAGRTALIWAGRTGRADVVRALLDAGASIDTADTVGQTALAAAVAKGHAEVVELLRAKHAADATAARRPAPLTARAAVEKGIPLLQRGAAIWLERARCGSCHHQPMIIRLAALARQRGFSIDETMAAAQLERSGAAADSDAGPLRQAQFANARPFDLAIPAHHFAESGIARDARREAMAVALAGMQLDDGRWIHGPPRVPILGGPFVITAAAAHVLQAYGPPTRAAEIASHIDRARRWLAANTADNTHDAVFRMLGLHWVDADRTMVLRAADALKKEQNADGGWTQLRGMNSDAYITGIVLVALYETGLPVTDPAYRRGIDYLLRNQEPDGSWLVPTRAAPQNPYFESGFPHGKFQFISFAGSCWATMALIHAATDTLRR
jgi:ankyrin repeat protein